MQELDNFIYKFKNLWQCGSDVKLVVDVKAGVASISLNVDVKLESLAGKDTEGVEFCRNGGHSKRLSPCRQRRRERREAERKARAEASEEVANCLAETVDPNPVVSESQYEISIDVPTEVKNYDIVECIEENFEGSLGDRNVALDDPMIHVVRS